MTDLEYDLAVGKISEVEFQELSRKVVETESTTAA
jgi:hypothetical protein